MVHACIWVPEIDGFSIKKEYYLAKLIRDDCGIFWWEFKWEKIYTSEEIKKHNPLYIFSPFFLKTKNRVRFRKYHIRGGIFPVYSSKIQGLYIFLYHISIMTMLFFVFFIIALHETLRGLKKYVIKKY